MMSTSGNSARVMVASADAICESYLFVLPLWGDIGSWGVMAIVKVVVVVVMAVVKVAEVGEVHV